MFAGDCYPAMTERNQMPEQRTHSLFFIGVDGVDAVQMARSRVDADEGNVKMFIPVFYKSVGLKNRDRSGERVTLNKFQFRFPDTTVW